MVPGQHRSVDGAYQRTFRFSRFGTHGPNHPLFDVWPSLLVLFRMDWEQIQLGWRYQQIRVPGPLVSGTGLLSRQSIFPIWALAFETCGSNPRRWIFVVRWDVWSAVGIEPGLLVEPYMCPSDGHPAWVTSRVDIWPGKVYPTQLPC